MGKQQQNYDDDDGVDKRTITVQTDVSKIQFPRETPRFRCGFVCISVEHISSKNKNKKSRTMTGISGWQLMIKT